MLKPFLSYTAVAEGITGLSLLFIPSIIVPLLLNMELTAPLADVVARIGGAAIFSVAMLSWMLRNQTGSAVAVKILLFYNVAVTIVLLYSVFKLGFKGPLLWLVIIFHSVQSVISLFLLKKRSTPNHI